MKYYRALFLISCLLVFTNLFSKETDGQVYVCLGKYSRVYHSNPGCRGLSNCKSEIYSTTQVYASISMGRRACCICVSSVSIGCDTDPTDVVTFNPYVQQIPDVMLTPQYYEALRRRQEAQARADAEAAEALVRLLQAIFTRTPEQIERARIRKAIRVREREERQLSKELNQQKKAIMKQNKKSKIGPIEDFSNKLLLKYNKKALFWGTSSIAFGGIGVASLLISNNLYEDYRKTSSTQANSLHNRINTFDAISATSFVLSGFSGLEFIIQNNKNKKVALKLIHDNNVYSGVKLGLNYSF